MRDTFVDAVRRGVTSIPAANRVEEWEWFYSSVEDNVQGELRNVPTLALGTLDSPAMEDVGRKFVDVFTSAYPDYADVLVGSAFFGQMRFHPAYVFKSAVGRAWEESTRGTSDVHAITQRLVERLERFVDDESFDVAFLAPLDNLKMPHDVEISPVAGITLRRMTGSELTDIWGGSPIYHRPELFGSVTTCAAAGKLMERKIVGEMDGRDVGHEVDNTAARFQTLAQILRTYKTEPTGVRFVFVSRHESWPMPGGVTQSFGAEYVPLGSYVLSAKDEEPLLVFSRQLDRALPDGMRTALGRLSFASLRLSPADRLIDAVGGMEALLLAALGNQNNELSFRFALHYAMLESSLDRRHEAYETAADLYRLRSTVAHGGRLKDTVKIAGQQMSSAEAADLSMRTLKSVIERLLAVGDSYLEVKFWRDRYLGFSNE